MRWKGLDSLRESRFTDKVNIFSNISYLFLLLLFIDFLSLGSGKLTEIAFGISTREILFGLTFLFSLPLVFALRREILGNRFVLFVGFFLLVMAVNVVRGMMSGYETGIILSDVFGYLYFLLLPVSIALLYSRERIEFLLKTIVFFCAVWAACSLILSYFPFFKGSFGAALHDFLHENIICSLTPLHGNGMRVYFHTASRWLFPAFLFATYFAVCRKEKRFFYIAVMALLEAAFFITYTRSFVLGLIVAVGLFLLLCIILFPVYLKRLLITWGIALLCGAAILTVISVTQQFNVFDAMVARVEIAGEDLADNLGVVNDDPGVVNDDPEGIPPEGGSDPGVEGGKDIGQWEQEGTIDVETELKSNAERAIKTEQLLALMKEKPLFGHGLGARIAFGNGYVEYYYYDLIVKMGIFGLCCFLLPFFYGAVMIYRNVAVRKRFLPQMLLASMVFFMTISYFNPCLNSVIGLSLYVLFLTVCYMMQNHPEKLKDGEDE